MNKRLENWNGHDIRFVDVKGEWFAILKDVCDALGLKSKDISQRLDTDMMTRVKIEASDVDSNDVRSPGENKTRWMLGINELGIYEALFTSRKLEARKFRRWSATVMQKLRTRVGLEGYEVMRMTDSDVQADIDHILDTLYWDEEKKMVMQSVTVQGGDVEQIPFE